MSSEQKSDNLGWMSEQIPALISNSTISTCPEKLAMWRGSDSSLFGVATETPL